MLCYVTIEVHEGRPIATYMGRTPTEANRAVEQRIRSAILGKPKEEVRVIEDALNAPNLLLARWKFEEWSGVRLFDLVGSV